MIKIDKNILIVDDELHNIELAEIILKKEGYTLFFALNAQECFEVIKKEKIDLLVLDLMLPDMDGYEVLEQLRLQQSTIDVIVVSALSDEESINKTVELGACAYISKPYDIISLKSQVKEVIKKSDYENLDIEKYLDEQFRNIALQLDKQSLQRAIIAFLQEDDSELDLSFVMSYLSWFSEQEHTKFIYQGSALKMHEFTLVGERSLDILQSRMNRILIETYSNGDNLDVDRLFSSSKYFLKAI